MSRDGLAVAVTGPTGELGSGVVAALEQSPQVARIVGMARRPFDPELRGWRKTTYRQGDVRDAASVRDLVRGADVVVHLAFAVTNAGRATLDINIEGSRLVFESAAKARVSRICHASSVAAYGFHPDYPESLTEDIAARGSPELPYSQQKAEVEQTLSSVLARRPSTQAFVFRPAIVAGPRARVLLDQIPYVRLSARLPVPVRGLLRAVPLLRPVLPDPGVRLQLVHEDDVASAFVLGATGAGSPGVYNLAAAGTITIGEIASAMNWHAVPLPHVTLEGTSELVKRVPLAPAATSWVHFLRRPPLVSSARARRELAWTPMHTAHDALVQMAGTS